MINHDIIIELGLCQCNTYSVHDLSGPGLENNKGSSRNSSLDTCKQLFVGFISTAMGRYKHC